MPSVLTIAVVVAAFLFAWCAVWYFLNKLYIKAGTVQYRRFGTTGISHWMVAGDLGAGLVHREMFIEDAYFHHGVTLNTKERVPFIVDVGANIGLFALACARKCSRDNGGQGCEIHSFEPIPILIDAARRNARDAMDKDSRCRITLHEMGLADVNSEATFEVQPTLSAGTSMTAKENLGLAKNDFMAWIRALVHDSAWAGLLPEAISAPLVAALKVPILNWILTLLVIAPVLFLIFLILVAFRITPYKVKVKLGPLSEQLDAIEAKRGAPISVIDMLKIDVEGAEWVVLQGIRDDHWSKVQQVVVEVHDLNGRVDKVKALLKSKGFRSVVVGTETLLSHELMELYTIFATR